MRRVLSRTPCSLLLLLLLPPALAACRKQPSQPPPDSSDDGTSSEATSPLIPAEPARYGAGESLEATIPLVDGGTLELAGLRGRPVLLEISASWEQGWDEAHDFYRQLLAEHEELTVIVIAAEADDQALLDLPPGIQASWDPAGALAAKFSVATFPTMFVLDREGRIVTVVNGWSEQVRGEIAESVAAGTASP